MATPKPVTAAEVAMLLHECCGGRDLFASEIADQLAEFVNDCMADPPRAPRELPEVAAERFLLSRLQADLRRLQTSAVKPGLLLAVHQMRQLRQLRIAELQRRIAELKARLPSRRHARSVAWSWSAVLIIWLIRNLLAETAVPGEVQDSVSLSFARKALRRMGYSLTDSAIDKQVRKLRRELQTVVLRLIGQTKTQS